jgi:hypothetical protein
MPVKPGRKEMPLKQSGRGVLLPVEGRRYLECGNLSKGDIVSAFRTASPAASAPVR